MADVSAALKDWSATSASNSPAGGATIGTGLDDNLREIQGAIVRGLSNKGADIASATTTDLGAVEGLAHDITGTTTITSFGTVRAGIWKIIKFEGALTLTHNATSLILPGAANITTADGDVAIVCSEGSGNWRCASYVKASGQPVALGTQGTFTATLTGCTTSPTVTATYSVTNNVVTLNIPELRATSNTTACTITGAPVAIRPATVHRYLPCLTQDNSVDAVSGLDVETSGVLTLRNSSSMNSLFTAAGSKGLWGGTITYNLN